MAIVLASQAVWPLAVAIAGIGSPYIREWGHHVLDLAANTVHQHRDQIPPLGDLARATASALPPLLGSLESHSVHWRAWLALALLALLLCFIGGGALLLCSRGPPGSLP